MTPSVAAELKDAHASLRESGPPAGRAWCHAWTRTVDGALQELAAPLVARHRLAVAAVGGYGRRELCPESDIDLLLLHDGLGKDVLEEAVRAIVYPLWDAGLAVGYAVRDRRQSLDATDDLDNATAILDLRTVAGDVSFAERVLREVVQRLYRRPARFLEALRRADVQRRARSGDSAEVLEPDLKNGSGGLRDIQSLRWAATALLGGGGLDGLIGAGYLGAPDRPRLARAEDDLLAARVALHLVAGKTDVLRMDLHEEVARRLGHEDAEGGLDLAPHKLLNVLYLAARTVDHVHRRAWALIGADAARGKRRRSRPTEAVVDGFELADGMLRLPAGRSPREPGLPMRLFTALADTGALLDRASAARLRAVAEDDTVAWAWTDGDRAQFTEVLWRGAAALPALAELDDVGLLVAMLPEWARQRGRAQRNPYHRYALDRHAWHAAAQLGELVSNEAWAAEALATVKDRDGLLLGVLFHDVGKPYGEPHNETGAPVAKALARRMGAGDDTVKLVGRLVRLHLVLPDAARRRDLADPALVREIAETIGDLDTLACLSLLAAADGVATGPTAWSDWTASLVRSLVTKVAAVLDETRPDEVPDDATVTAREAQALADEMGSTADDVRAHLDLLPARYAAAVTPRAVVRHTIMAASPPGPTEVRTRVTPGDDDPDGLDGIDELDVVALDHPGWFAKVAGVLALHGGSILAADAFTRSDGLAVDTFAVRPPEGASGSWWARVEGDLSEAAAGRLAVRARVARKARGDDHRVSRLPTVKTRVVPQHDPARSSTVIEIRTLDRIGVLYAIASALAELEIDIVLARIQTMGHEVVDVFYCRDADGQPLDDDHLAEVELAVTAAIDEL